MRTLLDWNVTADPQHVRGGARGPAAQGRDRRRDRPSGALHKGVAEPRPFRTFGRGFPFVNRVYTQTRTRPAFPVFEPPLWPACVSTKRPFSLSTRLAPCKRSSVCVAPDLFGRPELVSHFRREAISAIDSGSVVLCSNSSTSFSFDLAARIRVKSSRWSAPLNGS